MDAPYPFSAQTTIVIQSTERSSPDVSYKTLHLLRSISDEKRVEEGLDNLYALEGGHANPLVFSGWSVCAAAEGEKQRFLCKIFMQI